MSTVTNAKIVRRLRTTNQVVQGAREELDNRGSSCCDGVPDDDEMDEFIGDCRLIRYSISLCQKQMHRAATDNQIIDYRRIADCARNLVQHAVTVFENTLRNSARSRECGYLINGTEDVEAALKEARDFDSWLSHFPSAADSPSDARIEESRREPSRSMREFVKSVQEGH